MSDRLKFILRIAGFILACILLAVALYMVFFRKSITQVITDSTAPGGTQTGTLPSANTGTPGGTTSGTTPDGSTEPGRLTPSRTANGGSTFTTLLTNTSIESPTVTADGTVAYYDPADGKFYTIDATGNVTTLSNISFPKADNVTFDSGATTAVIEFPDGSNVVYDFESAKQITLPSHWESFSFSADGEEIAAKSIGTDASNRALVITSADGSSTQVIAALGDNDEKVSVSWSPNDSVLGFSATGVNTGGTFGRQEIYLIGPDGQATGALFVDGNNFHNIWSPDGNNLLYSVADPADNYKAALWYADSRGDRSGNSRRRMGIKTTVDKCTFASATTVYCGVPREMPSGGGSDSSAITAFDDVYKLNVSTGNASLTAIPAADTRIFSPSVSPDGAYLYYTDGSGRLNVIRLQ
ncbi:MAG: hypothetical protein AAB839_01400 [Patescibacteria group bacterium]